MQICITCIYPFSLPFDRLINYMTFGKLPSVPITRLGKKAILWNCIHRVIINLCSLMEVAVRCIQVCLFFFLTKDFVGREENFKFPFYILLCYLHNKIGNYFQWAHGLGVPNHFPLYPKLQNSLSWVPPYCVHTTATLDPTCVARREKLH